MTARDFVSNFIPDASPKMPRNLIFSFEAVATADYYHVGPDSTSEETLVHHVEAKRSKGSVVHSRPGQYSKKN